MKRRLIADAITALLVGVVLHFAGADADADAHAAPGSVAHSLAMVSKQYAGFIDQNAALRAALKNMCDKFEGRMGDRENAEFHDEYNDAIELLARQTANGNNDG